MSNYIYWPVMVNNYRLHITLKYLGEVDAPPDKVLTALKPFKNLLPNFYEFRPEIFEFKGVEHYVLEFTKFSPNITDIHNAVNFRPDDFPTYRPHVTVDKDFWHVIRNKNLKINSPEIEWYFGMPRYYYNGARYQFNYNFDHLTKHQER